MSESSDGPVFIVGAPRSGTTLVYSLVRSDPDFVQYEEGETRLLQCRFAYGPSRRDACFRRFMSDWLQSEQFERSGLDPRAFQSEAEMHRDSYVDLLEFFMNRMANVQGKARWVEKTPANIHHMKLLAEAFPSARFVHVIRDGRDVALSRRKLGWHVTRTKDPVRQLVSAGVFWRQLVGIGRRSGHLLGPRYHELRFEDLVRNPQEEGQKLASFTDADLSTGLTGQSKVGALESGFSAFEDRLSGISSAPVERWRKQLTKAELKAFHACLGSTLRALDYPVPERKKNGGAPDSVYRVYAFAAGQYLRIRRTIRLNTPLRWLLRPPNLLDFE